MLSRMIVRLLFKVGLSLGLLLGVVSYGHYLAGGDPGAVWGRVAGGALDGVTRSFGELRGKVRTVATVPAVVSSGAGGEGGSRRDSVWTWRDADGVVHYASAPPDGTDAARVTVDPDTNVLAPLALPDVPREPPRGGVPVADAGTATPAAGATRTASRRGRGEPAEVEALPGIAGAILNARGGMPAPDPARAEALLKLLQPTSR